MPKSSMLNIGDLNLAVFASLAVAFVIVPEVDNLSKSGLNILNGTNLNEVGIIPKKTNKLGFFEKLFHIFS